MVQALTAPVAIVADAVSFLASAWLLRGISHAETPPPAAERRRIGVELREGAGFMLRHPILRALAGEATTSNLGASMSGAIVVLFATRELHLSAGQIGIALSFSGIGGVEQLPWPGRPSAGSCRRHSTVRGPGGSPALFQPNWQ